MNIKILKEHKNSDLLVVTPLLPDHNISRDTKVTIKRNQLPFTWISVSDNQNIPTNVSNGLDWFKEHHHKPKYILPLDNDIILGRNMIDRMYNNIENVQHGTIAYTYASFKFRGSVNADFPARPFDVKQIVKHNYISSNSMIKVACLDRVGGFVVDDQYKRLLDWCLWLKFLLHGYVGLASPNTNFVAISSEDSISNDGDLDYNVKRNRVIKDFINPLYDKYGKEKKSISDNE
jgi:hypothetical protein